MRKCLVVIQKTDERSLSIWAIEVMINGKYHLGQGFEMATFIHFSLPSCTSRNNTISGLKKKVV